MAESYPLRPYLDGQVFTTTSGAEYFLLFRPEGHLFPDVPALHDSIFSILFFPLSPDQHAAADEQIIATIVEAIRQKMATQANVVIYIVDDSDGREAARAKHFSHLFYLQPQAEVESIAGVIQKEAKSIASVLLIHNTNPWKEPVVERFFELLAEFGKE